MFRLNKRHGLYGDAHEVFTEPFQETHDYHPFPHNDSQPTDEEGTLVETYVQHQTQGQNIEGIYARTPLEEILL